MGELEASRWRKYGKDRLYVSQPDGTRVGWVDLLTGAATIEKTALSGEFHTTVAAWQAGTPAREPLSASRPTTRVAGAANRTGTTPVPPNSRTPEQSAIGVAPSPEIVLTVAVSPVAGVLSSETVHSLDLSTEPPEPWVDLALNVPGQAARERARAELTAQRERSRVLSVIARVVDAKTDERNWRVGADGEETVGARLEKLKKHGWHVLHAVPVGDRDSDIDHVVIAPSGVFTLNTKNHRGKSVWVGRRTVRVDGHNQPYLRNSRFEAERASRLLTSACGFPVIARAALVFLTGTLIPNVTIKQRPDDVMILDRMDIPGVFKRGERRLTDEQVDAIFEQARRSTTWREAPGQSRTSRRSTRFRDDGEALPESLHSS